MKALVASRISCGIQATLAHLFDRNWSIIELCICCFVDGTETTLAYRVDDAITLLEHMIVDEQSGRGATGKFLARIGMERFSAGETIEGLRPIGRAARITVKRRRNHLIPCLEIWSDEQVVSIVFGC